MGLTPNEALSEFHPLLKIQGVLVLLVIDRVEEKASIASVSGLGKRLQNRGTCLVLYELNLSVVYGAHKMSSVANKSGCSL